MDRRVTTSVYEFGDFRLDPRRRVLARADGTAIALKPKMLDALIYLVEHAGVPLDKNDLMAAIWPNVVVEENNLNKTISVLRRVLGETPEEHKFIVTEPGRGYRFVATVTRRELALPELERMPDRAPRRVGSRRSAIAAGAAVATVAGAVGALTAVKYFGDDPAPPAPVVRFEIDAAKTWNPLNVALSPDGRRIAYVGENDVGTAIWLRSLDSAEPRLLQGTEGVTETAYPFWSPDGRELAFRSGRDLKRIDVGTGAVSTILDTVRLFRRGAWGPDGTILYATDEVIHRVSAAGGESIPITQLDAGTGEICHSAPQFLPDGKHFLYKANNVDLRKGGIYVGSLDGSEARVRLLDASRAVYVEPGYILYAKEHALYARAFDAERLEFTGPSVLMADDVFHRDNLDTSAFDAANGGTLIYRAVAKQGPSSPLLWVDRAGATAVASPPLASTDFRLSPDGRRIVFDEGNPPDVWILDLERGARTRVTSNPQVDHSAVWSPDGASVAFGAERDGGRAIYAKRADGAVPERLLLDAGAHNVAVTDWSADGRFILFQKDTCIGCDFDVWVLPTDGGEPYPYAATQFDERSAVLSPDGRWVAYVTIESGIYDVVVQPFQDPTQGKWRISTNGGTAPRWSRDGQEIYYYDGSGAIVRVAVATETEFRVGDAVRVADAAGAYRWDVTPDGERVLKSPGATGRDEYGSGASSFPITVILNWTSLLAN